MSGKGPESRNGGSETCEHGNVRSECPICRERTAGRATERPAVSESPALRLASEEKTLKTLDERRADELSSVTSGALDEYWKIEIAARETQARDHVEKTISQSLSEGSLEHLLDEDKGTLGRIVGKWLRKGAKTEEKAPDVRRKLFENWLADVEHAQEEVLLKYVLEHLTNIKKILPEFNADFFRKKVKEMNMRIEQILDTPPDQRRTDDEALIELSTLIKAPEVLREMFWRGVQEESLRKFGPLVSRVQGDVRMFLIKHINTAGLPPGEAQRFLREKTESTPKFMFLPELRDKEAEGPILGLTDTATVWVNLERVDFLENDKLDEARLAETLTHEVIHTVSIKSPKGDLGLAEHREIFTGIVNGKNYKEPAVYLNELATELLALEISSKYYSPDYPGTLKVRGREQQELVGYKDLMEKWKALAEKEGERAKTLKELLVQVMVRGNYDELKGFLLNNRDLLYELRSLCAMERPGGPQD